MAIDATSGAAPALSPSAPGSPGKNDSLLAQTIRGVCNVTGLTPLVGALSRTSLPASPGALVSNVLNNTATVSGKLLRTGVLGVAAPLVAAIGTGASYLKQKISGDSSPEHPVLSLLPESLLTFAASAADEAARPSLPPGPQMPQHLFRSEVSFGATNKDFFWQDTNGMNFPGTGTLDTLSARRIANAPLRLEPGQEAVLLMSLCPSGLPLPPGNATEGGAAVTVKGFGTPNEDTLIHISNHGREPFIAGRDPALPATPFVTYPLAQKLHPETGDINAEAFSSDVLPERAENPVSLSATALSEPDISAGDKRSDFRPPAAGPGEGMLPTLSDMTGAVDSLVTRVMAPGLSFGVTAEDPPENVAPDELQVREEMRQAWIDQNPEWTSTTAAPPSTDASRPPVPPPAPWTLQQETNGTLTFSHHAAVHLEDYALPAVPLNGTQSTPLRADQNDACFMIHAPGQNRTLPGQGGRVYRVTRQPFAVRTVLPVALTGSGLEPVALIRGADNRMTVAPQAPQLLPFLSSLYAARGPVQGSVTRGGDGLIRGRAGTRCLIDGRPFPVRTGPDGKHYIPSPDITFLSRKQRDVAGTKKLLEDLELRPVEVECRNGIWQMKPSAANGRSLLTFLAQAGLYGATTEAGSHTGHGFRYAGMTFPYEREVNATAGHLTLPAVTDPAGKRPPVPLDWYPAAGFGGDTGFYAVHSSEPDENAVRPAMTLDTMTGREKAGFVLKFLSLAVDSPLRTIRELWGDTIGDITSQEKLWKAVMNDGWEQDNEVGKAVASLADFAWQNIFASSLGGLGYTATTELLQTGLRGVGKTLMNQTLTREEAEGMAQTVGNMRFYMELPAGSSVTVPAGVRNRDNLPGLQSLERSLIVPALQRSPELPYDNVYLHDVSGTTWRHEAEPRAGGPDYPQLQERNGDLYMPKVPDGVQGYEPVPHLSEGSRLRPMTKEEADLSRNLVQVTGENVPENLYRDPRAGWQYVRKTDPQGVRLADRAVALHDTGTAAAGYDLYEVPGSGEMFRAENGRLRPLTVSEARERTAQLPSEEALNAGNYEKVYVINRDRSRTVEYAPKINRNSPQPQNGRSTYRYDAATGGWHATGKTIDADGRVLSLLGGGPKKRPATSDQGEPSNKQPRTEQAFPDAKGTGSIQSSSLDNERDKFNLTEKDPEKRKEAILSFRKQAEENIYLLPQKHSTSLSLPQNESMKNILSGIYKDNNGVVFGEEHGSLFAKEFIRERVDELYDSGVRTLYVEIPRDGVDSGTKKTYQQYYDELFNTCQNGKSIDDGTGFDTQDDVLRKYIKKGIRVQCIDSLSSRTTQSGPGSKKITPFVDYNLQDESGITKRLTYMNYFAYNIIKEDKGKWAAWVGRNHVRTRNGIPGISELTGGVGIDI